MRRYLIVDDNKALAENLAEILRDEGAQVVIANDGAEALELVRGTSFDALVTDMRMPVMNGSALLKALRTFDQGLPAVVITAYTGESDLSDARHSGILAVLPKPVPIEQLLTLLERARRDALVAIVDDDASLSDNLTEALRARGFTALSACSALETERFGTLRPFVALVDLRIPGSTVGALVPLLSQRYPGLPVLVMSGYPDAVEFAPQQAVFAKPFSTDRLLDAVENIYAGQVAR